MMRYVRYRMHLAGLGRQSHLAREVLVVAQDIHRGNVDREGDILCRNSCHVEEEEDVLHIGFALEDHSGHNSLLVDHNDLRAVCRTHHIDHILLVGNVLLRTGLHIYLGEVRIYL